MNRFLQSVTGGSKDAKEAKNGKTAEEVKPEPAKPNRVGKRSSFEKKEKVQVVKELPVLSDTAVLKREALFRQKLELCNVIFDFEDPDLDVKGKEQKERHWWN